MVQRRWVIDRIQKILLWKWDFEVFINIYVCHSLNFNKFSKKNRQIRSQKASDWSLIAQLVDSKGYARQRKNFIRFNRITSGFDISTVKLIKIHVFQPNSMNPMGVFLLLLNFILDHASNTMNVNTKQCPIWWSK